MPIVRYLKNIAVLMEPIRLDERTISWDSDAREALFVSYYISSYEMLDSNTGTGSFHLAGIQREIIIDNKIDIIRRGKVFYDIPAYRMIAHEMAQRFSSRNALFLM